MKTRFWISFAVKGKNLGVVLAEAESVQQAVEECSRRGCNPGGEALGYQLPPVKFIAEKEARNWFKTTPSYTLIDPSELPTFLFARKLSAKQAGTIINNGKAEFVCKDCNEGNVHTHQN